MMRRRLDVTLHPDHIEYMFYDCDLDFIGFLKGWVDLVGHVWHFDKIETQQVNGTFIARFYADRGVINVMLGLVDVARYPIKVVEGTKTRYFHSEADTQVTTYRQLIETLPHETLLEITVSFATAGIFSIGKWISESLSAQTIPSGTWTFYLWCYRTGGAGNIFARVYKRVGTEEILLAESTKGAVPTAYAEVTVTASFPETSFAEGNKIVVELFFEVTTGAGGKKGYFACDTSARNSRVATTEVVPPPPPLLPLVEVGFIEGVSAVQPPLL